MNVELLPKKQKRFELKSEKTGGDIMNKNEEKHTKTIDKIIAEVCDLETKRPKEDWENCPLCKNDGIIPERQLDIDPDGNISEETKKMNLI